MSDKLQKASTEIATAASFANAVEKAVEQQALARPALRTCPACGQANMRDAQAQFVGACSPRCAKALGISEEVLKASGRVDPSLFAPETPPECRKCGGCGSVSVPGRLEDVTCGACQGTGVDDPTSDDVWAGANVLARRIAQCGAEWSSISGRLARCSRRIDHEGSHVGQYYSNGGIVTWIDAEVGK